MVNPGRSKMRSIERSLGVHTIRCEASNTVPELHTISCEVAIAQVAAAPTPYLTYKVRQQLKD